MFTDIFDSYYECKKCCFLSRKDLTFGILDDSFYKCRVFGRPLSNQQDKIWHFSFTTQFMIGTLLK